MAKLSSINKNNRRIKLSDRLFNKRAKLKKICCDKSYVSNEHRCSIDNYRIIAFVCHHEPYDKTNAA